MRRLNRIRRRIVARAVAGDFSLIDGPAVAGVATNMSPNKAVSALQISHIAHQMANPGQARRRQILGWLFDLSTRDI
ncbi:hypothetical protein JW916_01610 [Candidatus Sumerlaeota bacterium]|nr:hypothetical protein [Candidatus Sumerlaeota bacterium]